MPDDFTVTSNAVTSFSIKNFYKKIVAYVSSPQTKPNCHKLENNVIFALLRHIWQPEKETWELAIAKDTQELVSRSIPDSAELTRQQIHSPNKAKLKILVVS